MAYELHIERPGPIELEEWRVVVSAHPLLEIDETTTSIANPETGEVISIPGQAGTAALALSGQWTKVFRWRRGKISFVAPAEMSEQDPVLAVAFQLASQLSAVVRGDEGESYGRPL